MIETERFEGAARFFEACRALKNKRVGILGHLRPDGDCLGAQILLHEVLEGCGAVPLLGLSDDYIAENLRWLTEDLTFMRPEDMCADAYVFVDCGAKSRGGDFAKKIRSVALAVDHHISGEAFAKENFLFPEASATCEILADFCDQKHWELSPRAAQALYVGIVTDTGKFSYASTTALTLYLASRLASAGADPHEIFVRIYQNEPRAKFELLQRFLASMRFYLDGTVCTGNITEEDYRATGTTADDTEGFVNYPRSIAGVRIAIIAYTREGRTRFSLRTDEPELRLDILAGEFHGGGHACAAAFTVNSAYDDFEKVFINALQRHLELFSKSGA